MTDINIEREVGLRTSDLVAYQKQDRAFVVTLRRPDCLRSRRWWERNALRHDRHVFVSAHDNKRLVCADETEALALLDVMQREINRELRSGDGPR